MAERTSFIVYYEWFDYLDMLRPESAYKILHSVRDYLKDGKESEEFTEPAEKMAYSLLMRQVTRDTEKYLETCEKRSEAGRKGGRPVKHDSSGSKAKKANAFSEKQAKAKKADNEYEYEPDNENEYDNGDDVDYVSDRVCGKVESSNTYDTDTILSLFQDKYKETFGHDYKTLSTAELDEVKTKFREKNVTEDDINTYFDRKFYGTGNGDVNHFLCDGTFKLCRAVEQEPPHKDCEQESTVGKGEYLTDEPIVIGVSADPEKVSKARSDLHDKQAEWQKFMIVQPDWDSEDKVNEINASRERIKFFANAGEKELNDPKNQAKYGKESCEIALHTLQAEQQTTSSAEI